MISSLMCETGHRELRLIVMKVGGVVGVDGGIGRGIKASVRFRLASWVGLCF